VPGLCRVLRFSNTDAVALRLFAFAILFVACYVHWRVHWCDVNAKAGLARRDTGS
jgi:hypothetical protein